MFNMLNILHRLAVKWKNAGLRWTGGGKLMRGEKRAEIFSVARNNAAENALKNEAILPYEYNIFFTDLSRKGSCCLSC